MSSRPLLTGSPTVEVDQWRYDELLRKEARLQVIAELMEGAVTPPKDVILKIVYGEDTND